MGIDDESSHPELFSEVAGGVTRNIVCLFREPDAGNPPVRVRWAGCVKKTRNRPAVRKMKVGPSESLC